MSIEKVKAEVARALAENPDATMIWLPAGVWAECVEALGEEHHGPNTAGQIARQVTYEGLKKGNVGHAVPRKLNKARPDRMMGFDVECHVKPLLAAIAAREQAETTPTTKPNE